MSVNWKIRSSGLVIMTPDDAIRLEHISDTIKSIHSSYDVIPSDIPDEGLNMAELLENAERTLLRRALEVRRGENRGRETAWSFLQILQASPAEV